MVLYTGSVTMVLYTGSVTMVLYTGSKINMVLYTGSIINMVLYAILNLLPLHVGSSGSKTLPVMHVTFSVPLIA